MRDGMPIVHTLNQKQSRVIGVKVGYFHTNHCDLYLTSTCCRKAALRFADGSSSAKTSSPSRSSPANSPSATLLPMIHNGRATLPYDSEAALAHLRRDKKLAALIERAGPFTLKLGHTGTPFTSLLESILYQQLHGKAAATIHRRVRAMYGEDDPSPHALLSTPEEHLRAAGVSGNKIKALRDLASRTLDGTVPTLDAIHAMPDAEVIARLTEVRGIGPWTVEMLLIFRLGRPTYSPSPTTASAKASPSPFSASPRSAPSPPPTSPSPKSCTSAPSAGPHSAPSPPGTFGAPATSPQKPPNPRNRNRRSRPASEPPRPPSAFRFSTLRIEPLEFSPPPSPASKRKPFHS